MRTTVTLDADVERLVRARITRDGVSFDQAVNDSIREGNPAGRPTRPYRTRTASLGVPRVNLGGAIQAAADLADDELIRRMRTSS